MSTSYLEKAKKSATEIAFKKLKEEFRKWYAMLSVEELTKNQSLIREIEAMEKMFNLEKVSVC